MRSLGAGPLVEVALVVAILALGKPLLVPVALAFHLAFVLTPPAERLERLGVPRALSVAGVVVVALSLLAVVGSVLVSQAADLARQMKTYSVQMGEKLSALRSARSGLLNDFGNALTEVGRGFDAEPVKPEDTTPVRVVSDGLSGFAHLEESVGTFIHPVAVSIAVLVMAIFVLGHREDLRGRLIRLVGTQNVTVTTRTMAEAVNRVSHFLLAQVCINAGCGAVIAGGLYFIGVPYALLWGVLAGVLRFVPLLGAAIATLLPSAAAFAIFPGFQQALLTVGLILGVDLVTANFVEPLVLGKRAGVSALALLISALFWVWLWGPLGLVLATPLTVCAAVVGRHVPRLSFLTILLGDEPGLKAPVDLYQRILANATRDAQRIARRRVAETSLVETLEELVVPALGMMVLDRNQQTITESVAARVVQDLGDIVRQLSALRAPEAPRSPVEAGVATPTAILAIPAESDADALLLEMLAIPLLERHRTLVTIDAAQRAKLAEAVVAKRPSAVCIAALPPNGGANARFLCRRLRAELPEVRLVVLAPESTNQRSFEAAARLREAGASGVAYGLREATELLGAATILAPET